MTRLILFLLLLPHWTSEASPSSIDVFALPTPVPRRFDLKTEETVNPELERWYLRFSFLERDGEKVKHGVLVERARLRDRERFDRDYLEVRRMFSEGVEAPQRVESTYREGVLRERTYIASESVQVVVTFNEAGQEIAEPGRTARGAQRKRERITSHFDTLFEINTP